MHRLYAGIRFAITLQAISKPSGWRSFPEIFGTFSTTNRVLKLVLAWTAFQRP
jgi:hypothetical protein